VVKPGPLFSALTKLRNSKMDERSMEALLKDMSGRKPGGASTFDMTKEVSLQLL